MSTERTTHQGEWSVPVDVEAEVERVAEILRAQPDAVIVNGHDVECCSPDGNHLGVCPTDGAD